MIKRKRSWLYELVYRNDMAKAKVLTTPAPFYGTLDAQAEYYDDHYDAVDRAYTVSFIVPIGFANSFDICYY